MRFFIDISYDGTDFHGWQKQPNAITIQEVIEGCFEKIFGRHIELVGAGRTDTGVHAKQLLIHFDTDDKFDSEQLVYKLNRMLPASIAVNKIFRVNDEAHARFDAVSREYHYQMSLCKNPFHQAYYAFCPYHLDLEKMNAACTILKSHRNFQSFSKVKTDAKTYICKIEKAEWVKDGDKLIFTIIADRFLRNMVRAIVGTLIEVGRSRLSLSEFEAVIKHKNRSEAGTSVAAKGLFLYKIDYPDAIKYTGK